MTIIPNNKFLCIILVVTLALSNVCNAIKCYQCVGSTKDWKNCLSVQEETNLRNCPKESQHCITGYGVYEKRIVVERGCGMPSGQFANSEDADKSELNSTPSKSDSLRGIVQRMTDNECKALPFAVVCQCNTGDGCNDQSFGGLQYQQQSQSTQQTNLQAVDDAVAVNDRESRILLSNDTNAEYSEPPPAIVDPAFNTEEEIQIKEAGVVNDGTIIEETELQVIVGDLMPKDGEQTHSAQVRPDSAVGCVASIVSIGAVLVMMM